MTSGDQRGFYRYYRILVMALSLQIWVSYTLGNAKLQRKSENAVNCNHVLQFLFDNDTNIIKSVVQASMRDRSYKVEVR